MRCPWAVADISHWDSFDLECVWEGRNFTLWEKIWCMKCCPLLDSAFGLMLSEDKRVIRSATIRLLTNHRKKERRNMLISFFNNDMLLLLKQGTVAGHELDTSENSYCGESWGCSRSPVVVVIYSTELVTGCWKSGWKRRREFSPESCTNDSSTDNIGMILWYRLYGFH